MKGTNGQGNGRKEGLGTRFTTEVMDENPYLQSHLSRENQTQLEDDTVLSIEDEYGAPTEPENELKKTKQHRRRVLLMVVVLLFLLGVIGALTLYYRTATRVEYGRTGKREVMPPPPQTPNGINGRDGRTEKAIEEAQRITVGKEGNDLSTPPITTYPKLHTSPESPFTAPSQANETVKPSLGIANGETASTSADATAGASPGSSSSNQTPIRSQRSSETSLYIDERRSERINPRTTDARPDSKPPLITEASRDRVVLPAFASMLPVRSIGAFYTLRTGALVRFELTRDIVGNGWSMKRGTILVGISKGSDFDRAYVGVIGFLDPKTGKLVKLGGEALGGDGGSGLKGKRRQLDSGWLRALSQLGSAAMNVTAALLSGGDHTVIVSDGLRTRAINPVTEEISGVLGNELDRRQGRSFVEVLAGTPGYVMVTDLPSVIKGDEPTPEVNGETLADATNVNATRSATGLSELELADLLANGSTEDIRSAMPRMSAEMRKVAEAVLRP